MKRIPTIKVTKTGLGNKHIIINESDFDATVHTAVAEKKTVDKKTVDDKGKKPSGNSSNGDSKVL